jgi:iron complex outermembrane receptor protein
MRSFLSRTIALATLLFVSHVATPLSSLALPATPTVRGVVKDSVGQPLPDVTVVITALRRSTTSDISGRFAFIGLPAGRHHVDVFRIGFARTSLEVEVPSSGADVTIEIVLVPSIVRLTGVVVAANPAGGDPLGITQSTVDLSGMDLARSLTSSVAQTLSSEAGMAVRYNGPAATLPIIRGLGGDRILVLQNGERTGDLSSAASDHGLTIDPLAADRVEVVRGPASLMYGSSALGGVVNVIANDIPASVPDRVTGWLTGQTESVTPGGAGSGSLTIPAGHMAVSLGAGLRGVGDTYQGGGDRLLNSDAHNDYQSIGVGVIGAGASGGVAVKRYAFRYGIPGEATDPEFGASIDGIRKDLKAQLDFVGGGGAFGAVHIDGSAQTYSHDEIESSGEVGTSFGLKTQTLGASVKTEFGALSGALGLTGLRKQYDATGEEALTPAANSNAWGAFVFEELVVGHREHPPTVQFGARLDQFAIDSKEGDPKFGPARSLDFNAVTGSIGVTLPTGEQSSFAFNLGRAFRAPTVEELFSNAFHAAAGTFDVGNPDLDSEINQGAEAVFRIHGRRVHTEVSAYYNAISNFVMPDIQGDTITDEGETVPLNHYTQDDATFYGLEATFEAQVGTSLVAGLLGDVVRASLANGGNVPFLPPARLGGHLRWDNGHFNVGAEARHGFAQTRVSGGAVDVPTDAYTVVNLSAAWHLEGRQTGHTITLRADNLFDTAYRDATSRIKSFAFNPGRNFSLAYKIRL